MRVRSTAAGGGGLLFLFFTTAQLLTGTAAGGSDPINFSFPYFSPSNRSAFNISTNAGGISEIEKALQITPDTSNVAAYLLSKSGRIVLSQPFRLWDGAAGGTTRRVASFNTSFDINIARSDNATLTPGEGFAFIIVPDPGDPPAGSDGGYLGLTNSSLDGQASNRLVAIEFDDVKQPYDPDGDHVGLDINSVRSNVTSSLAQAGIDISPVSAVNYTVWINYDGAAKQILVRMAKGGKPIPETAVLTSNIDLSEYVSEKSYFGFSAATGAADYQRNSVLAWNLTVENLGDGGGAGSSSGWKVAAGAAVGAVVLVVAVVAAAVWWAKKRRKEEAAVAGPRALEGKLRSLPGMPREFEYKELKKATNNFDEKMKLGQGGFGVVYMGMLPAPEGEEVAVAVKRFSREDKANNQDDFLKELTVINRLRHKNLVRLLGWCHSNGVLLLVYDYMPNGSLDHHLYGVLSGDGGSRPILPWNRRTQILTGVASALHYLHHEYDECVVHRDIKSSNIMLDADFNALLGDFGLARVLDAGNTSYIELEIAGVPGTMGYIAPECFHAGKATRESDVFAFGAVVLEVVAGRRPRSSDLPGDFHLLADWVWDLHCNGLILDAVDQALEGEYAGEDARRLLLLGLACSHPLPAERPKTAAILRIISGSVPPPEVPEVKPAFRWPPAFHAGDEESSGLLGGGERSLSTSALLYATYFRNMRVDDVATV
ncbi:putative L-type lectin-domain containing receptor kinase S.5 [Apostasia shenzhenica]|uniref:Putative L-type lectin-domain containing receptor kinase S.5 n=1 Tax=Apostasia shenzhenica TaxID=1088818 RepID=A0A2I0A6D8_9ASPA|nr:putative L-type lectin-domain containing receptor kinase S.5 [Apostasia shenzhenica]